LRTQQIAGRKAVYVAVAVAYAADPDSLKYLRRQVWRWMAGFFQNVRLHGRQLPRAKPMLALWVFLAVFEILTVPLWYAWPPLAILWWHQDPTVVLGWWFGAEFALILPPLLYAAAKRHLNPLRVISYVPFVYLNKLVNFTYAWKALVVELILVPLGLSTGLTSYQKGRA
jgi:N-acetylglucosaminyltransferase